VANRDKVQAALIFSRPKLFPSLPACTIPSIIKMKPALILALNPCIDVEWCVDKVRWEEKNSILSERRWPGGKGINVSRWLHYLRQLRSPVILPLPCPALAGGEGRGEGAVSSAGATRRLPLGGYTGTELDRLIAS